MEGGSKMSNRTLEERAGDRMPQTQREKDIADYIGLGKKLTEGKGSKDPKVDLGKTHLADDKDLHALADIYSTKENLDAKVEYDNHVKDFLKTRITEHMEGKRNFSHLGSAKEKNDAAEDFVNMLMHASIEKYYIGTGMAEKDAKEKADGIMGDAKAKKAWEARMFPYRDGREGIKKAFLNTYKTDANDIRNMETNSNIRNVYSNMADFVDPHSQAREDLDDELKKAGRKDKFREHVESKYDDGRKINNAIDSEELLSMYKDGMARAKEGKGFKHTEHQENHADNYVEPEAE